ncbi:hypothetical protein [Bordetella petrii]|uniref:hypothetical protein n=1 Tax=Bordetella petrii TaxID=94624 RepID=UPI001A95BCFC|nr:hypothetical protein [Bordetella petrii]MBO1111296.1 hypothetical protein [Bordetella petrii]
MNKAEFFEDLKDILRSEFCSKYPDGFDSQKRAIDYNDHMDARIKRFLELIRQLTERLRVAREDGDEIAMQAALIRIRSHAMSLSTIFDWIVDDIETLLKSGKWPEIPEGYRFPE